MRDDRPRWTADWAFDLHRHEDWPSPTFRCGLRDRTGTRSPDLPPPAEEQAAVEAVVSPDLRDVGSRREGASATIAAFFWADRARRRLLPVISSRRRSLARLCLS